MDQIDAVRAFNRLYLSELELLDRSYLGSGMGVTEVRVLYELSQRCDLTARALARSLALDEAYLSRLLRVFRTRGWLSPRADARDARQQLLCLTDAGHAVMAPLEQRSRARVASRLASLSYGGREVLVQSLHRVAAVLGAPLGGAVALRDLRPGDAGWIIGRHGALYAAEEGYDETFEALVADILAGFLRGHDPARERGWIAEQNGERLGSIFCMRAAEEVAKLRLFFLEPHARGLGLGRRMLDECIGFARSAGYHRIVLWTHRSHAAACALYAARGFVMVDETPTRAFGRDVVDQVWELEL